MAVARGRNNPPAKRCEFPLDPLTMGRQHLRNKRLIALQITLPRHLALEIDRANDIGKQDRFQVGHRGGEQ